jgi:AraC-like DNA-binding protein
VGEIFARSERYFKLLSNTYVFKVEKGKSNSQVYLHRPPLRKGIGLSNEATFSATVVVLKAITDSNISPVTVSFQHSAPQNLNSYNMAFNCEILFDQPDNIISYKTEDLETRTAKADESINKFLLERVDEETQGIEVSSNKVAHDVEVLIRDSLPSGIPAIMQVAEQLGMSNRTLTRRLSENGVTFRELIRRAQETISKDLLRKTNRSIAEIAFETGFSEQSAFNRAFKRWTDLSPIDFRKS